MRGSIRHRRRTSLCRAGPSPTEVRSAENATLACSGVLPSSDSTQRALLQIAINGLQSMCVGKHGLPRAAVQSTRGRKSTVRLLDQYGCR